MCWAPCRLPWPIPASPNPDYFSRSYQLSTPSDTPRVTRLLPNRRTIHQPDRPRVSTRLPDLRHLHTVHPNLRILLHPPVIRRPNQVTECPNRPTAMLTGHQLVTTRAPLEHPFISPPRHLLRIRRTRNLGINPNSSGLPGRSLFSFLNRSILQLLNSPSIGHRLTRRPVTRLHQTTQCQNRATQARVTRMPNPVTYLLSNPVIPPPSPAIQLPIQVIRSQLILRPSPVIQSQVIQLPTTTLHQVQVTRLLGRAIRLRLILFRRIRRLRLSPKCTHSPIPSSRWFSIRRLSSRALRTDLPNLMKVGIIRPMKYHVL